ncbi:MAG: hypothetical protein ACOCRU_02250 [bacterium]
MVNNLNLITSTAAKNMSEKVNELLEQEILEIIADYDVELAVDMDDWAEGNQSADVFDLNDRIEIRQEYTMTRLYPLNIIYLDGQPIAEYRLVGSIGENRSVLEYKVKRL